MGDRMGTPSAVGLNFFDFFLFARSTIKLEENEQITVIKSANGHTTLNAPVLVRSPEDNQRRARIVLGWETAWVHRVLLALIFLISFYLNSVPLTLKKMNKLRLLNQPTAIPQIVKESCREKGKY